MGSSLERDRLSIGYFDRSSTGSDRISALRELLLVRRNWNVVRADPRSSHRAMVLWYQNGTSNWAYFESSDCARKNGFKAEADSAFVRLLHHNGNISKKSLNLPNHRWNVFMITWLRYFVSLTFDKSDGIKRHPNKNTVKHEKDRKDIGLSEARGGMHSF